MSYTSIDNLKFLLQEVHDVQGLFKQEHFSHMYWEQSWMMVESAKQLADRDMAPYFREMDEKHVYYDGKGNVISHPQLKNVIKHAAEQGWISGAASFKHGGLQLPLMIFNAGSTSFKQRTIVVRDTSHFRLVRRH